MTRFPAGRSSTSIPGSSPSFSGSTRRSRPSPPGKSVDATSSKWRGDGVEGLREAPLDRRRELRAELLELVEALFEVLALRLQVREALLLGLVLLAGERVDLPERAASRVEPFDACPKLLAVVALGRLDLTGGLEPPRRVRDVGVDRARSRPPPPSPTRSPPRAR